MAPSTGVGPEAGRRLLAPEFLQKLEILSLLSRKRFRGAQRGDRRSLARGRGLEFDDGLLGRHSWSLSIGSPELISFARGTATH